MSRSSSVDFSKHGLAFGMDQLRFGRIGQPFEWHEE